MANTFKSVTSGSIGTTLVTVYTCPASTTAIVLGASMANTATNPIGGSINLAKNGSSAGQDDVQYRPPYPNLRKTPPHSPCHLLETSQDTTKTRQSSN